MYVQGLKNKVENSIKAKKFKRAEHHFNLLKKLT
jgi:hypothetical protein